MGSCRRNWRHPSAPALMAANSNAGWTSPWTPRRWKRFGSRPAFEVQPCRNPCDSASSNRALPRSRANWPGRSNSDGSATVLSTAFRPPRPISPTPAQELITWLHGTMVVLESAIGSADFLDQAARALLQIVGLDAGRVLLLNGDDWTTAAIEKQHAAR